jgi:hypothetical protein
MLTCRGFPILEIAAVMRITLFSSEISSGCLANFLNSFRPQTGKQREPEVWHQSAFPELGNVLH